MREEFWFESEKEDLPKTLFATINEIDKRQSQRYIDNLLHLSAYTGKRLTGLGQSSYDDYDLGARRISLNVTQACTDTITSKIGKNNPKITVLTDNGNYSQQQRAKKLSQFINGQFQKLNIYRTASRVLKVGCVFGDGFIKIWQENSRIMAERTLPHELIVDSREAIDGSPRTLYQVKMVSKQILKKIYPDKEELIEEACKAGEFRTLEYYDPFYRSDMVAVAEGWRLPSRKGTNDGRHVISISTTELLDENWKYDYFPFPKLSFSEKVMGFWSAGIPEILYSIQAELDRVMERISDSIWINSVPRVLYEYSSKIVKEHFNNEVGSLLGYRGAMPTFITPQSVGPDVFSHIDRLYQKAFEIVGISQMSVGSSKPKELSSGKAIRESQDVESDRFAELKQAYDSFHLEIANQIIDRAKEIYEYDKSFAVITQDNEGTEIIKWSEVDMDRDAYVMQVYPTNLLSAHPSGRLADVLDLMGGGLLGKEDALSLLDFPDIKAMMSSNIQLAQRNDILATISKMVDTGKFIPPEINQNLNLGVQFCQAFYLTYKNKGVPEKTLNNLLLWISEATALIISMTPPPMPPEAAGLPTEASAPTAQGI
jgi:hypothetical protein